LPLYCVRTLAISPSNMSLVMGASGAAGVVSAILVPALSDRLGRKPVMVLFTLCGAVASLAPLYTSGGLIVLIIFVFVGSLALGTAPLFMATIPLETAPERDAATATGLIMGVGQILGGFLGPALGGQLADRFDLSVPLWNATGVATAAALTSLRLDETAPGRRNSA
jgi:predicted MFS family arabinose efflux permease